MPKLIILSIIFAQLLNPAILFAQQPSQAPVIIDAITPSPLPTPSPQPSVSFPPSTTPPPSIPPSTPFTPTEPNLGLCEALTIVYDLSRLSQADQQRIISAYQSGQNANAIKQEIIRANTALFDFIYPKPQYIANHKQKVIEILKSDIQQYKNLEQSLSTAEGKKQAIEIIKQAITTLKNNTNVAVNINQLAALNETNIDAHNFYYALFRVIEYAPEKFTTNVNGPYAVLHVTAYIADALRGKNWPNLPNVIVNNSSPHVRTNALSQYPSNFDWEKAYRNLDCIDLSPKIAFAGTPLIHIYSDINQPLSIKFSDPKLLTFSNQPYSYLNGFSLTSNMKEPLYYEFKHDHIDKKALKNPLAIVKQKELKGYLTNHLLPKLNLTSEELNQFTKNDIEKSLIRVEEANTNLNLQIFLVTKEQIDNLFLLKLNITPTPTTLIRNMIVITFTDKPVDKPFMQLPILKRSGLTVVENGILVLD